MLRAIEPVFELRFIEQNGTQKASTAIDKFPAIVGHKGTVIPTLLNGQISSFHCTIGWNWVQQQYQVEDGMDGKPSTNHIYYSDGGELEQCDRAVLKTLTDRVYLMRTMDGKEGYLELFDPSKEVGGDGRSTLSLDPELVELRVIAIDAKAKAIDAKAKAIDAQDAAIEIKAIAQKNSAAIGDLEVLLDPRVRQTIAVLQAFGEHPRVFLLGAVVVLFTGLTGLSLLFLHSNMDNIYRDVRDRNQHNGRMNEPDRTTSPGG